MKLKLENMIQGITCLKKYMYDSLNEQQKKENQEKLNNIDQVISNLNRNIERNIKNEIDRQDRVVGRKKE